MALDKRPTAKLPSKRKVEKELYKTKATKQIRGRGECAPIETGDMTASLNLALDSIKRYGGKPVLYAPTPEGLQLFISRSQDYFVYVNEVNENPNLEKKLIPDIEGWAVYMGTTRKTILDYANRGGQWADVIDFYKNAISNVKKQLAQYYKIPSTIYIFDACNNHGYSNTNEFKISATTTIDTAAQSELERELISSGLTWNDDQADFDVIDTKGEYVDNANDIRHEGESNQGHSSEEGRESGNEACS